MTVLWDKEVYVKKSSVFGALVVSILFGLSPLAADPMIQRGLDVFTTMAKGATYIDFAQNPLPAGFFCANAAAFTGKVALKGLPLATAAPGQLWGADTLIERLDDAVFDASGTATTRIRFRALSMVSVAPVKTACGAFHVYVALNGRQRATTMKIYRTEEGGGSFVAPLAVNARISFVPVKPGRTKDGRSLTITKSFTFPEEPLPWSFQNGAREKAIGSVVVDTNGDQSPDTLLPGTSNFVAGRSPDRLSASKFYPWQCPQCAEYTCHRYDGEEEHCTYTTQPGCPDVPIC
jgi:hypothetical protein